jgi:hypothetical protein
MIDYSLISLLVATGLVLQFMAMAQAAPLTQVLVAGVLVATFALRFAPAPWPIVALVAQCLLAIGLLIHARATRWHD